MVEKLPLNEKKSLRIAILTTETSHHAYFVREISDRYGPVVVFEERRDISVDFETHHAFEDEQVEIEQAAWFDGKSVSLADYAPVTTYHDVNDPACIAAIQDFNPDALIVFGTGRLSEALLQIKPDRFLNFQSAKPEDYSGIDTHLWCIYHRDFEGLITTLHRVESETDKSGVVLSAAIPVDRGMKLAALRRANTELCVTLAVSALDMLMNFGQFISRPQNYYGRRYSFMPSVLKTLCVKRFEEHTSTLPED